MMVHQEWKVARGACVLEMKPFTAGLMEKVTTMGVVTLIHRLPSEERFIADGTLGPILVLAWSW